MKSAVLFLALALAIGSAAAQTATAHFADADNEALVARGKTVYGTVCAACHGRRLQGQALWQLMDRFAGRRAPPHDATGHTWRHSDDDLFAMTKFGHFPGTPPQVRSWMPAFGGHLSDREILAVIAYIKSNWPTGIRASQAMLNPGEAGMPKDADTTSWTLPPNCIGNFPQWRANSK